jgi:hypothetical protein
MFNIDFFFTGKPQGGFVYLLAININNRKCWAIPVNVEINEAGSIATIVKSGRSTESYLKAFRYLIPQTKVRFIRADQERSFQDKITMKFYRDNDIEFIPVEVGDYHVLGIIDRMCWTIRDMAYRMKVPRISPDFMSVIMNQYNNSPHTLFSKIMKKPTSPNDVYSDEDNEIFIFDTITKQNEAIDNIQGYELPVGTSVKLYWSKAKALDKRRALVYPDFYTIVGKVGHNIQIKNNRTSETKLVPRWMIQKADNPRLRKVNGQ